MGSIARRTYGRIMWGSSVLTTAYWYVIAAILMAGWLADTEVTFFKPEIIVPLVVGLLGLFIALWLANRERNQRIIEGYFYKTGILEHVERMMDAVSVFYIEMQYRDPSLMTPEELSRRKPPPYSEEETNRLRNSEMSSWQYHQRLAEMININTFAPAEIRADVAYLLRHGIKSIDGYLWNNRSSTWSVVKGLLLEPLSKVTDSYYFAGDSTQKVKDHLRTINRMQLDIKGVVSPAE